MIKTIVKILVALLLFASLLPFAVFYKYKQEIYTDLDAANHREVAIVFGAGLRVDGTPSEILRDRLKTAASLYYRGLVDKILVSGDNRFVEHNEPESMARYLIDDLKVPEEFVIKDFAGRRTYDTCARASDIWSIDRAVLITQGFHLPRALFICNALGIDSVGLSATRQDYILGFKFKLREGFAIYKAIFDVYVWTPGYVKGEKEEL
ncbi:hypothetical protein COV81_01990 [Candidatus Peregrinibacteria bacterium CG11_big_fil_rev_8_21_14_0_20_41_10]|nr:MAG: hypothetical protein COV81_01990 [Candidatus Peregrinibacteria bacterium CG11_big_fil_rev_8_21_14_0_20_41_10]PIZ76206.1 MAG: hypothetical protein COY06_02270 [Candidatus Peregrinibacteria bacterium CG_4_10_14_0_2_um_filter_41_8]PJC37707.1 MAG: hypothetical protein CO045_04420 [Candidatus Peregrinibacteria bacterium CG_4_9_14_0_2_um_filter_41_14]